MTRRQFLVVTMLGAAAAAAAYTGAFVPDLSEGADGLQGLSAADYQVLRAAAGRVLDGAPGFGSGGMTAGEVARWIDQYLLRLPLSAQGDVRLLLRALQRSPPFLLGGRASFGRARFTRLPAEAQDDVLRRWQQSRLAPLRQGFQGLKSLCCLAFYQDPRSFAGLRYGGPLVADRAGSAGR